ncbi:MAG: tRNA threonylcarbamoyladenosine biosynthesis protein TsaB [Pseudohongiellaceae bacterium]
MLALTKLRLFGMPKLLVIDTSSSICSVGLFNLGLWHQLETGTPRQAAQEVLGLIDSLLSEADLALQELDAIVIASGPGSFTGLRIGIGIAQGLAAASSLPVIGVSNLALLAYSHLKYSNKNGAIICLSARNEESYWAQYRACQDLGVKLQGIEKVISHQAQKPALNAVVDLDNWLLAGDGWDEALLATLMSSVSPDFNDIQVNLKDLCDVALMRLAANLLLKPEDLTPNYVKEELDYLS